MASSTCHFNIDEPNLRMLVPGGGAVRSHRHNRPKPPSFNAALEAMRHHHSTVTLPTHRSPPLTTVRRRHCPVRFRRRPIEALVTVLIERKRTGRSQHTKNFMGANQDRTS